MLTPKELREYRKTVTDGWGLRPSEGVALLQHIEEQAVYIRLLETRCAPMPEQGVVTTGGGLDERDRSWQAVVDEVQRSLDEMQAERDEWRELVRERDRELAEIEQQAVKLRLEEAAEGGGG